MTVRLLDAKGRLVRADGNHALRFTLSGGGAIAGVDNGDPTNHEPFKGPTADKAGHKAFHGLALLIVRADRGPGGTIRIKAVSEGLEPADSVVTATPPP